MHLGNCNRGAQFAYDSENHLVTISGDDAATYVYDADGQRVKASFGHAPNVTTVVCPSALLRAGVGSHFEQRTAGRTVSTTQYYLSPDASVMTGSLIEYGQFVSGAYPE